MNKKHIISEIIRTTKENGGKPLGIERFEKETGIKREDWYGKYWTKWSDVIKEAGYEPNKMQCAYDEDWLIKQLIYYIREIKKFPTKPEFQIKAFNDKKFPSYTTFKKRLGDKYKMAKKVVAFCEKKTQFSDVLKICIPMSDSEAKKGKCEIDSLEENFGFVYLMKSGKYFKIGRSNYVEKRNYELGIRLPEELQILHRIKTDDPNGIEAYWHKRFEGKRKKGEWFDLSPSDVKAFKRRKFM